MEDFFSKFTPIEPTKEESDIFCEPDAARDDDEIHAFRNDDTGCSSVWIKRKDGSTYGEMTFSGIMKRG